MPQETSIREASQQGTWNWFWPWALLICGIFLYLQTFVFPFTPRAATGDQSIYLHDAARMFDGEMIYRDFDHFTLPGTDVLYLTLFKMFGVRAWIPEAMLILIGIAVAGLSYKICTGMLSGATAALPGLLFVVVPLGGYLDATHHWYSTLLATGALALVIERRTAPRVAGAGALWGAATCFAQSMVLGAIGLALFLVWERQRRNESRSSLLRKEGCLFTAYIAVLLSFAGFFAWKVGATRLWDETVVFVLKFYSTDPSNTWRAYMSWRPSLHMWTDWPEFPAWALIHLLLPLVYVLFFVRYRREAPSRPEVPWEGLMLVNVTGIAMFLMVASAPAFNRLYTVSLPALILLVWFLSAASKVERILLRGLWAMVIVLAVVKPVVTQVRWKKSLELPTGRVAFFNPALYEKTRWLLQRTQPGEYFFGDQLENFELRLRNPGRVAFVVSLDYTRPEQVADLVGGLEQHQVRFVSWYAGLDSGQSGGDHLGPLRHYLREHYRMAQIFTNGDEMWERTR